jgi:streptomycin 6-kinase
MYAIPNALVQTTTDLLGADGLAWLDRLPAILGACEQRWSISLGPPFPRISYNYAAPATRADGTPAVLKSCYPDHEPLRESEALRLFDGQGAVRLLAADLDQGVLLLERAVPGTPIGALEDDEQAVSAAASVLRRLWRPAPAEHPVPTVADWGKGFARLRERFGGATGPFPPPLVERAERLFAELAAAMATPALLHGDLNYGNVLAAERESWLAIDPKGLIGEPVYDTGVLLRDPLSYIHSSSEPRRLLARRIDQLAAELGFDRVRIRDWGFAQAVLSAWWSFEDHGRGWEPAIACAELLAAIQI